MHNKQTDNLAFGEKGPGKGVDGKDANAVHITPSKGRTSSKLAIGPIAVRRW